MARVLSEQSGKPRRFAERESAQLAIPLRNANRLALGLALALLALSLASLINRLLPNAPWSTPPGPSGEVLLLFLASLGVLSMLAGRRRAGILLGTGLVAIALTVILLRALAAGSGESSRLAHAWLEVHGTAGMGLSLAFSGLGVLFGSSTTHSKGRLLTIALLGSMITALAVVALCDHLASISPYTTLGRMTDMPMISSLGFALIGCSLLAHAADVSAESDNPPSWAPLPFLAAILTASILVSQSLHEQTYLRIEASTANRLHAIQSSIDAELLKHIRGLDQIAYGLGAGRGISKSHWIDRATHYVQSSTTLAGLAVLDSNLQPRIIVTSSQNRSTRGPIASVVSARHFSGAPAADRTEHLTILRIKGQPMLAVYVPIGEGWVNAGYVVGLYPVGTLLKGTVSKVAAGYAVTLLAAGRPIAASAPLASANPAFTHAASLGFLGLNLTLQARPTEATVANETSRLPEVILTAGFAVAILMALVLRQWQLARRHATELGRVNSALQDEVARHESARTELMRTRRELELRVDRRTEELSEANARLNTQLQRQREYEADRLKLAAIVESSNDGIIGKTLQGIITSWNAGAQRIYGYTADEMIGRSIELLQPPERPHEIAGILTRLQRGEAITAYETTRLRKDGSRIHISLTVSPIKDTEGTIVGTSAIEQDITARKLAEIERDKHAKELLRSNQELQQFAYVASHDLQEPLRMVSSYAQLLAKRYREHLDQDANDFIDYMVDGVKRMQALIDALLTYSRVDSRGGAFEMVDCGKVVARAQRALTVALEDSGATITVDSLPSVRGDPTQLGQLFQNLLSNAIKFRGDASLEIRIAADREKHYWHFRVCDNGIGMESQYAERIFVIFQRLHNRQQYPGTGIGLAICKKIVERHGGSIWVESSLGAGSCFHFTIPLVEEMT